MGLKENLSAIGIDSCLCDLDDTLIGTGWVFGSQMLAYSNFVAQTLGEVGHERILEKLDRINREIYKKESVNPKHWDTVVVQLATEIEAPLENLMAGIDVLGQIYQIRLSFLEGAKELLMQLKEEHVPLAIVTHANEDWTWRKVEWLGLLEYIDRESLFIVSEDKHKSHEDWAVALEKKRFIPGRSCVVGDNLTGDIMAAHKAGVGKKFYIPSTWSVYNQGEIPENTTLLKNIGDFVPTVENLARENNTPCEK